MSNTIQIETLIVKFLTKEADLDELRQLELWLNNPKNEAFFKEYVKANALAHMSTNQYDIEEAKDTIALRIRRERNFLYRIRKSKNRFKYSAAAAILAGVLTITYFFEKNSSEPSIEVSASPSINTHIQPGTSKAVLTLGNGSNIALEKGDTYQTQNMNTNGEQLIYKNKEQSSAEPVFNYLTIPRGGQFFVVLSDGTQIWLNSESRIKYPVSFNKGETRTVELVYGEAYFDVSPAVEHHGSKFKVLNDAQEIEVLGTAFNVKAYKDETTIYTTLVEGKVRINTDGSGQNLLPDQQASLDLNTNDLTVSKVDIKAETSWKNGIFSFENKSLKDIMRVLSRWYDVQVVFENKALESIKFKGTLNKDQSIDEILSIMKSTSINNYQITDKTITLN
ncbi:FecR family protein [Maribacter sp. 2304DJ31-5]|uniref:FecR family protein n=1 Tax=Maribacter sp. 2304DJ31-5 TaxID=3386273 RepID=UPI0039BD739A